MISLLCHYSTVFYPECWKDVAAAYNISHIFVRGNSETIKGFVTDGPAHKKPRNLVCLVHPAEGQKYNPKSLFDYIHPKEAIYAFGPDDTIRSWINDFDQADYIYIPTPGATELYSFITAAMVLYDREVKNGSRRS